MRLITKSVITVSVLAMILFGFNVHTDAKPPINPHHRVRPIIVKHPVIVHVPTKPLRPVKNHLWVPRYKLHTGVLVGGHWRPPLKEGFYWKEGHWNGNRWIPGHWVPNNAKPNHIWVPGYWDGSLWIDGYWRPGVRIGFTWIDGYFNGAGVWITGHWLSE